MDKLENLPGVGPATAKKLAAAGLTTFAAIASLAPEVLAAKIVDAGITVALDAPGLISAAAAAEKDRLEALAKENGAAASASIPELMQTLSDVEAGAPARVPEGAGGAEAQLGNSPQAGADAAASEPATAGDASTSSSPATNTARAEADQGGTGDAAGPAAGKGREGDGDHAVAETIRVTVTGPKRGRWRAGRHFTADPRTVELSLAEFDQVVADPTLSWEQAD